MPLEFQSESHGAVAFGFFNIETDMLLLNQYFFFCTDFCQTLSKMAVAAEPVETGIVCEGYLIADSQDIGDLMGAISGARHTGFIGALYRKFPFPKSREAFKQNPEGDRTRAEVEATVKEYGRAFRINCSADRGCQEISIGEYRFTREVFQALIQYVWRGGYPRWKDEKRPSYVLHMGDTLTRSSSPLFAGLFLST